VITLTKNLMKRTLPPAAWERFRNRTWRYVRPITVDYCPVVLPWFPAARAGTGAGALHRLATSFHWRNEWSPMTALCVVVGAVRWPFQFAFDAGRAFARYAGGVERQHGVSRWSQLRGLVRLGLGSNVPPLYFYRFRMFEPANAVRAAEYIHAEEMDVLYPTLAVDLPSDVPLRHKEAFYEHASRHGLPVVPPVATFADGEILEWHDGRRGELPQTDLVLKPVDMACGRGFERWTWDESACRWHRQAQALDEAGLLARCRNASKAHRHILQRRITNHRDLVRLAGNGLSTIRVVTFRRPHGETGVLLACLRMPTGRLEVDNFEAGGIAAPIALHSGVMGKAVAKDPRRGAFPIHPDSGAQIEGVEVPLFKESIDATLAAHNHFPWVPFVGWDVVVTDGGPLLLEANPNWCVELAQIVMGSPLGESAYPDIFLAHLACRSADVAPVTT
jgi:hypothetical protein